MHLFPSFYSLFTAINALTTLSYEWKFQMPTNDTKGGGGGGREE